MTSADQYRVKAAEFLAKAHWEANPRLQLEYTTMAQSYLDLAILADQNNQCDMARQTPNTVSK